MKLNHLNLTVDDVPAARTFLAEHFGLRPMDGGMKNFDVLFDDDDLVLTLMGAGRNNDVHYPKTFHVGFMQPSEAHVDAIHRQLTDDGYDVDPPSRQHGSWTFYFMAPGGFTVEVLA